MAAERRALVVDQVMAEYRAYCAGELSALLHTTEAPGGRVEYCGADEDPAHWAICYVRASNRAVVPLAVGHEQRVAAEFDALDRRCAAGVWDPLQVPIPVALIGGREYPFKPARGRQLLGIVQLDRQAVLLAAADERLVAVLVDDGTTTVLPLGRPRRVREVDVDLLRAWARPHAAATSKACDDPLRPSAGTKAHHIRIVPGRRVELGEGPTISQLLAAMFADIEARATTPPKLPRCKPASPAPQAASVDAAPRWPKRPKLKGKTWVPLVLKYLRKMALEGSRNLVGLSGTIQATIQARFPEFKITGEAFTDALKLIAATGTCLVAPHQKGERIWRINLEGLCDPTSAQHRRLCRETRGRVRVEEAAANQRSPGPDAPVAGEGEPSRVVDDADATPDDATDKSITLPDEPRDTPTGPDTGASDADRSAAQAEPASNRSVAQAEALELVRRLGTIPIAGHIFLLACRAGMAEVTQHTDSTDDAAQGEDEAVALDTTGDRRTPVEDAQHTDAAVVLDAAAPNAAVAADFRDAPPADQAMVSVGLAAVPDPEQASAGECAAGDAPPADTRAADAKQPTRGHDPRPAPLRDAVHRHQAFASVHPEPRCRDLGTLGPRGPPASRSR